MSQMTSHWCASSFHRLQWSLEYLQLAKLGDVDAMVTLAEIQFSQRGYGQIAHNPVQARRWLEYAASKGDLTALATLKRLTAKAKAEKELAHQVRRYQIHNLENPKLGPDAIDKIDEITRTGKYADVKPTLVPPKEKDSLAQAEEMIAALEEKAKRENAANPSCQSKTCI